MKRFILGAAVVAVLVAPAAALASTASNWPDSRLDAVATSVAGHPVSVWCESSDQDWVSAEQEIGSPDLDGFTFQGMATPTVFVAPHVCATLHYILQFGYQATGLLWDAEAIETLIHESVHQRGITDEAVTDCTAMPLVEGYAISSFGFPAMVTQTTYRAVSKSVRVKTGRTFKTTHYTTTVPVTSTVRNPDLDVLGQFVQAWHKALPAQYQGVC